MNNHLSKISTNGVGYNNKDNKDKEDNIDKACQMNNAFSTSLSAEEADASSYLNEFRCEVSPLGAEPACLLVNPQPTPLNETQIKRALIQLFDNGESSSQRYKLKIKFNLTDGDNPEFIASLTKDMRNFKKYIPQECQTEILHFASQITKNVKSEFNVKPYIGKLHLNQGRGRHIHSQIEPYTAVAIWWNQEYKAWAGVLMFQDWLYEFDLFNEYITDAQQKQGVRGQTLFINPKYDTRIRPKTWTEQRLAK